MKKLRTQVIRNKRKRSAINELEQPLRKKQKLSVVIKVVKGDLLDHSTDYIMHQTNCLGKKTHPSRTHIATQIFEKYPDTNVYVKRSKSGIKGVPGTIDVNKPVISLMGQYYPGRGNWDGARKKRLDYFKQCLQELKNYFTEKNVTIGFPYRIACGLAGGDWKVYKKKLDDFNKNNNNITLVMYKL